VPANFEFCTTEPFTARAILRKSHRSAIIAATIRLRRAANSENGIRIKQMALVTIKNLSIGFRGPLLLDSVNCQIEPGQRIGLLGRNGEGKTTLLRILCGDVEPDHGDVQLAPLTTVALLPQDVPQSVTGSVSHVVAQGWLAHDEERPEWKRHHSVQQIISRMDLDGDAPFEALSSGMKRRVLLARSLVSSPDLLLLDEPTNHLDIDAITWLEDFLSRWSGTLIFVTHDRMFLRRIADRIFEIDRGRLFDWSCDYDTFLKRKQAALDAEEKQNALFDKKLAQEEVWIRQGIKARRTRNEGRVRALERMRRERSQRRALQGKVSLRIDQGQRSGNLIAEVDHVSFAYGDRDIVRGFSTTIERGDKVGLIGPNGAGKTTLLRIILGQLPPQSGSVRLGTKLQIAYFDQLREQLADDLTVQQNVGDGGDTVRIGGQATHVIGYLQDFLFSPERARTPVRFLSGGERNRVLLARLFAKPANVIVLDEPTNDLDAETLELLEERLVEFEGTLLLVTHDRAFLNNVVTSTIVFEPDGVKEYAGGYDDWLRQRRVTATEMDEPSRGESKPQRVNQRGKEEASLPPDKPPKRRLTYREQQELTSLPATIEQLEAQIAALHDAMARPDFYQQPGERIAAEQSRLKEFNAQLTSAYERWEELESR
jgi:ATP-binding cassette subfamily F protein uup